MDTYTSCTDKATSIIFPEWQEAKEHIYPVVLQAVTRPGGTGQSTVYDKFLDLYICYSLRLALQEDKEPALLFVNNKMLGIWGTSRDEMAGQAMENMKNDGYKITSIHEILKGMGNGVQPGPPFPLYVLTNQAMAYGAAGILDHGMVSGLARKLGADLFLIPSSVHEILLLPDDGQTRVEELNRMVMEVNDSQVAPRERLSDRVYRYNRELDKIEIPM